MVEASKNIRIKAEMLERTHWANEFTWRELEIIARYLRIAKSAPGDVIVAEGFRNAQMFIIVEGSASVVKEDMGGRRKILAEIGKGKAFGEMALFDGEPRSASVVAKNSATMLVLERDVLDQFIDEYPKLAARLLMKLGTILSQRLRMTSGKLVDLL